MQKKLLLFIIPVAVLFMTMALVMYGLASKQTPTQQPTPSFIVPSSVSSSTTAIVSKETELFFNPAQITATSSTSSYTSSIMVKSGSNSVTAVQLEMTFDPKLLTDITLESASGSDSFFDPSSPVLFKKINQEKGTVFYAVGIAPNKPSKTGTGVLAHLTFKINPNAATFSSQITFLGKTMVTQENVTGSVLKRTAPLTILIPSP